MNYELESGRIVRIPDKEIEKGINILGLTKEESIQMYLDDRGITKNDVQEELCKKAKDNNIMATVHKASAIDKTITRAPQERTKKEEPTKEMIISKISELLKDIAECVVVENPTKLITFNLGEEFFKLDLIKRRKPK